MSNIEIISIFFQRLTFDLILLLLISSIILVAQDGISILFMSSLASILDVLFPLILLCFIFLLFKPRRPVLLKQQRWDRKKLSKSMIAIDGIFVGAALLIIIFFDVKTLFEISLGTTLIWLCLALMYKRKLKNLLEHTGA